MRTYVIEDRAGGSQSSSPDRLLLMLHGHGATEHDFTALGPLIDPAGHYLVVGARGSVEIESGGAAWFEFGPMGADAETLHDSMQALDLTLERLCAEHLMSRDEAVVAGFSQGGAMALALGLGRSEHPRLSGVICHSGFVVDAAGLEYDWSAARSVPVLILHGRDDAMVPVELARDGAASLAHHGVPVVFRELDMAHQSTLASLTIARDWLSEIRRGARPHDV